MIKILYFASVRERLNKSEETMELPEEVDTVAQLVALLSAQSPEFRQLNEGGQPLLVSVNQIVADGSASLAVNDEVAFFPPMTGG